MSGNIIVLDLPVPPSVNRYWRNYRGRMVLSAEARAYKQKVAVLAHNQGARTPLKGDVSVVITWWRKHKRGDLDNLAKGILDSLKGIAYVDDSQVATILATRVDDPDCEPSISVAVEPL